MIDGADDDTGVLAAGVVEVDEVPPVQSQNGAAQRSGKPQNVSIGNALIRLA